ncbi:MAG TPA: hypothetical protein VMJ30_04235 [Gemmatimonadales bacterium]|nr:hypothetical protein [Gemmatimonadales bacterium]
MKVTSLALAAALALPASALNAQSVVGGFVLHSGPVSAHVVIGQRPWYPPPPRVMVVHRSPSIVIVQRGAHRGHDWWRHQGYRRVTVWYDARRDCYYSAPDARFPGLRAVVVYQNDSGYYRPYDNDHRSWDGDDDR